MNRLQAVPDQVLDDAGSATWTDYVRVRTIFISVRKLFNPHAHPADQVELHDTAGLSRRGARFGNGVLNRESLVMRRQRYTAE